MTKDKRDLSDKDRILQEYSRSLREALEKDMSREIFLRSLFDGIPFPFLILDHESHIKDLNKAAAQLLDSPQEKLVGRQFEKLPFMRGTGLTARFRKAAQSNEPASFETYFSVLGKWLEFNLTLFNDHIMVLIQDVSARKRTETVYSQLWRETRSLADNYPDGTLRFNIALRCIFYNRMAEKFFGLQKSSMGSRYDEMNLPSPVVHMLGSALPNVLATGKKHAEELELTSGKIFAWRFIPEYIDKNISSILVLIQDVTGRKEEEQERQKLVTAIEETSEGIALIGSNGTISYVNTSFSVITGHSKKDLVGKDLKAVGAEISEDDISAGIENAFKSRHMTRVLIKGRNKNTGTPFTAELRFPPFSHFHGLAAGVALLRDVTNEIALEEQLRETQKLEAIGTLSGGIAHDFNNILAIILGNAELVLDDFGTDTRASQYVQNLRTAALRGRDLIRQILTFSRRSSEKFRVIRLSQILEETVKMLRSTIPSSIDIGLTINADHDTVMASPSQIQQILINLSTNAVQAMQGTGNLTISLEEAEMGVRDLPDDTLRPGNYVILIVSDTGHGMNERTRQKIFEPFYTTREQGEGTGLGLAVVYGIVKILGGWINVRSAPGKGASFRIFIPQSEIETYAVEEERTTMPGGYGHILVVDDEAQIIEMMQGILSTLGYKVTGFTDPKEALESLADIPKGYKLVITDQTMPGISGLELTRKIHRIRPDIPVILATGYSAAVNEKTAAEAGVARTVIKPLTRRELAQTVHDVLTGTDREKQ